MSLVKQTTDVQFTSGLDTKSDDFSVISSRCSLLTNGRFVDKTSISTRPGFRPTPNGTVNSSPFPAVTKRTYVRGEEPLVEADNGLFVIDPIAGFKQLEPNFNRCLATLEGVDHRDLPTSQCDAAYLEDDDLTAVVWAAVDANPSSVDSFRAPQVWLRVSRAGTELFRQRLDVVVPFSDPPTGINSYVGGAFYPRVVATDSLFHIYWFENTAVATYGLGVRTFDPSTMTLGGQTTIAGFAGAAGPPMDVVYAPFAQNGLGAVFATYSDGFVISQLLDPADGVTIIATTTDNIGQAPVSVRAVALERTINVNRPAYCTISECDASGTPRIEITVADLDNGTPASAHSVSPIATVNNPTGRMAVMADPNNNSTLWAVWDSGTKIALRALTVTDFTPSVVFPPSIAETVLTRNLNVASDMWTRNGAVYMGVYNPGSTIQTTWFAVQVGTTDVGTLTAVVAPDADVCARISLQSAFATFNAAGNPPHVFSPGTGKIATAMHRGDDNLVQYNIDADGNVVGGLAPVGVDLLTLDYEAQLNTVRVGDDLVLAGADPQLYDGADVTELGFEYFPEGVTLTDGGADLGTGLSGTYAAVAVYEWTDVNGQLHRSAPSVPVSVAVAAGHALNMTVPTLRLTKKTGVQIVAFLTGPSGTIFYRQGSEPNNPLVDSVVMTTVTRSTGTTGESITTAFLKTPRGELLYTTGNALPSMPYPACKFVSLHQTRLVFSGCEQANRVNHTEERVDGLFPGYNPVYAIEADQGGGRVAATQSIDDKLIIFQEEQISGVFGRGPNLLGLDNNFSNPTKIVTGYNHSWEESNVIAPDNTGIWFRDEAGLRHLDRSLQISKVQANQNTVLDAGAEVDELIVGVLSGAATREGTKQVYFGNSTSGLLVWDFQFQQWSTYLMTDPDVIDVAASKSKMYFLDNSNDVVWYEDPAIVADKNAGGGGAIAIPMSARSSWIKVAGLQGFGRLYKVLMLLQDVVASSTHTIEVEYDYLEEISSVTIGLPYDAAVSGEAWSSNPNAWLQVSIGDTVIWSDLTSSRVTGFRTITDPMMIIPDIYAMTTDGIFDDGAPGTVTLDERLGTPPSVKDIAAPKYAVPRLQLESRVAKQKCESIRVTYSHTSTAGGVRVSGMTLQLGVKKGTFKLPSNHRVT